MLKLWGASSNVLSCRSIEIAALYNGDPSWLPVPSQWTKHCGFNANRHWCPTQSASCHLNSKEEHWCFAAIVFWPQCDFLKGSASQWLKWVAPLHLLSCCVPSAQRAPVLPAIAVKLLIPSWGSCEILQNLQCLHNNVHIQRWRPSTCRWEPPLAC